MPAAPVPIRGVIEGFYGVYYTWPERNDLIRFLGLHGFNTYIYAPKNDRQHRARWWQPYPEAIMREFARTVEIATRAGITFTYALTCTIPPHLTVNSAIETLIAKFRAFHTVGVRAFCLLFDDLELAAAGVVDPPQVAAIHAHIANTVYAAVRADDASSTLSVCPTDYHGRAPFSAYLHAFGDQLDPSIETFYTGPDICAPTITAADATAFAQAVQRPPIIWDNYPVNDLAMRSNLHLGAIRGRSSDLSASIRGIVINTMPQAEASKIALHTYAAYLHDPISYDPQFAWHNAINAIAGVASTAAVQRIGLFMQSSCLAQHQPAQLRDLIDAVMVTSAQPQSSIACSARFALHHYLDQIDEDCYHLKYHMVNLRLRDNLLPWIEALEAWLWLARRALSVLEDQANGVINKRAYTLLDESLAEVKAHPKHVDAEYVMELIRLVNHTDPLPHTTMPVILPRAVAGTQSPDLAAIA